MKTVFTLMSLVTLSVLGGCSSRERLDRDEFQVQHFRQSTEELRKSLDDVLQFTQSHRQLNTDDHAAWQILHGFLTF